MVQTMFNIQITRREDGGFESHLALLGGVGFSLGFGRGNSWGRESTLQGAGLAGWVTV